MTVSPVNCRPNSLSLVCLAGLAGLLLTSAPLHADDAAENLEFFEKRVRPVLVEVCQKCHGATRQESGLRLDSRQALVKGGDRGAALDLQNLPGSRLLEVIGYEGDLQMPPKGKLPADQIAALAEWVRRGAAWPEEKVAESGGFDLAARRSQQWALQPRQPTAPPAVEHADWVANPVDRFVVAELERAGLAPNPRIDKRGWLRRVTFDLVGLPPTLAEIEAFLADQTPQAEERVVDRLLASERYGERWARHWLDLVRYAETSGHEFDFEIPLAYEYRDYVIRALNADVPYDQFVREHVAGDLLPEPRRHPTGQFLESPIATGFWFLGESKHSPVDIRVDSAERLDNQVDVFAKAFLAQTVGCARCHDHKFDAISARDYHALCGFLQSSRMALSTVDRPEQRQELGRAADTLHAEIARESLARLATLEPARLANWLNATLDVLRPAEVKPGKAGGGSTQVFADFEGETWGGWTTTGNAFGARPNRFPLPDYQGNVGALGQGLVNSHSALDAKGQRRATDELTGTLTSPVFTIRQPYIHFLVGGGAHAGKTCVNLKLDPTGEIVRTVTGKNNNRLEWTTLDVRQWEGKAARIEIVDAVTGGWGNIGCDEITFSPSPRPGPEGERLETVAQNRGLDAQQLAAWVDLLRDPNPLAEDHPLRLWKLWVARSGPPSAEDWQAFLKQQAAVPPAGEPADVPAPFAQFTESFDGWFVSGEAFGAQPLRQPTLAATGPVLGADPRLGLAHSGARLKRLHGTLRSPTFEIPQARILYRVAGQGARLRLVIDQFQQIRYPIYGGLEVGLNSPQELRWIAQDVSKWVGHTAYIELLDEGDGFFALEQVRFSDTDSPPVGSSSAIPPPGLVQDLARLPVEQGAAGLVRALCTGWREAAAQARDAGTSPAAAAPSPTLVAWGLRNVSEPNGWLAALGPEPAAWQDRLRQWADRQQELEASVQYGRRAIGLVDGSPLNERLHPRGNPNRFADEVPRRFLESLGGTEGEYGPGSGRLELARRLVDPANPLTSRVIVNRIWKHHFGEGLVRTVDDFGNMGQPPTHPALLDWLANEFIRQGWSLKSLHRLLVLSRTYALTSDPADSATEEADPLNKLLHRAHLRRLEGETIRDAMLAVSGRLDTRMYGPGVMPHLTPFMIGRGRPGSSGPLDGDGRRSVYLAVRRNFLNPLFQAFDSPVPFTTIGRRSVSNVPAQALAMLNNPLVVQQAELWARRALAERSDEVSRIEWMYETAFARPARPDEIAAAREFLATQSAQYAPDDRQRGWTDLAHVLFNVKEFVWIP